MAVKKAMEQTGLPREKIGIFFISPCPSKVTYVKSPLGTDRSEVDRVLAIKDVYPQLISYMQTVDPKAPDMSESAKAGLAGAAEAARPEACLRRAIWRPTELRTSSVCWRIWRIRNFPI